MDCGNTVLFFVVSKQTSVTPSSQEVVMRSTIFVCVQGYIHVVGPHKPTTKENEKNNYIYK